MQVKQLYQNIRGGLGLAVQAKTPVQGLFEKAVPLKRKIKALDHEDCRLSVEGNMKLLKPYGNTGDEKLDKLQAHLDEPQLEAVRFFIRQVHNRLIKPGHVKNSPIPKDDSRLNFLVAREAEPQLLAIGSSIRECYALAFRLAGEKYPECFGTVDDLEAHQAYRKSLERQWQDLLEESMKVGLVIGVDLTVHPVPQGMKSEYSKLTFSITGDAVAFGDGNGWFNNVVEFLVNRE